MLPNFLVHTALAGLLGVGMLDVAFADSDAVSVLLSLDLCAQPTIMYIFLH